MNGATWRMQIKLRDSAKSSLSNLVILDKFACSRLLQTLNRYVNAQIKSVFIDIINKYHDIYVFMFMCTAKTSPFRDYGNGDSRYLQIGRGILFVTIAAIVKTSCYAETEDRQIAKAIREGINTIRLHHKENLLRQSKAGSNDLDEPMASPSPCRDDDDE
jgi:hypothetical protein